MARAGRWKKGESGNPAGIEKQKPFLDQLTKLCIQEDYKRLRGAAQKLLDAANEGEPWAVQMVADRTDGKPSQQMETSLTGQIHIVLSQDDANA